MVVISNCLPLIRDDLGLLGLKDKIIWHLITNHRVIRLPLTLSCRRSLSHRNQSTANQWTCFYVIGTSAMTELRKLREIIFENSRVIRTRENKRPQICCQLI